MRLPDRGRADYIGAGVRDTDGFAPTPTTTDRSGIRHVESATRRGTDQ
jgi:hypothetical protein